MKKIIKLLFIVFFVICFSFGLIGLFYSLSDDYFNRINNSTSYVKVPIANSIIVSGTMISEDMVSYKSVDASEIANDEIVSINDVIGYCVANNVMVNKGSSFKVRDLIKCVNFNVYDENKYYDVYVDSENQLIVESIFRYILYGFTGEVKDVVLLSGCNNDNRYEFITILTTDGLYSVYIPYDFIGEDGVYEVTKLDNADEIVSLNIGEYDLSCVKYPVIKYKDFSEYLVKFDGVSKFELFLVK